MSESIWTKDTLLDISVNIIPLFILGFFVVAFIVFDPFGGPLLGKILQLAIVLTTAIGLIILTHQAAIRIETPDEE